MRLISRLVSIATLLVEAFKRMLCFLHLTRRRKNSGTVLPLHADVQVLAPFGEVQASSLPSNSLELESWDSWDTGNGPSDLSRNLPSNNGSSSRYTSNRYPVKKIPDPDPEPEVDYFQELQLEPSIRKTKKVVVRKKDEFSSHSGISSRLVMSSDIPVVGSELGTLDDPMNSGWADEAMEDLSTEAELAIRDKRRIERERRLAEHQMKKQEKMAAAGKKDHAIASKLS